VFGATEPATTFGRAAELDVLTRGLVAAQSGRGGALLITGEAGIGKSRMLAEAEWRASARGMAVLHGRSVQRGGPYRPIAEALVSAAPPGLAADPRLAPYRSVLARLLPGWPGAARADRSLVDPVVLLGEAVLELLAVISEPGGVVLVVDDLHWADPDSLALLGYLAGRVEASRVLLVGAARDDEPGGPALHDLSHHASTTVLPLHRLHALDIGALARDRVDGLTDGSVELVVHASDGLPLLVEELAAALDPSDGAGDGRADLTVPRTLAELTYRRLDSLPATVQDVLHTAAILGGLDWELLPAAGGFDEDDVARALRAGMEASLLVLDPAAEGSLRWRHALTRDAVLARLLPLERASLARRAAEALDTGELAGDRMLLVAELYALCGRGGDAARLLLDAADAAVDAGALGTAEQMLRRAIALAPGDHDLTVQLVRVLSLAGRADEATTVGTSILDAVHGERRVLLCLHLARAAVSAERWADAARFLAPVADSADPRVDALRAHVALGEQDVARSIELAGEAATAAELAGRPEAVCEALEIVGRGLRRVDPDASEEAFARAERLAGEHGLTVWRIRALSELGANDLLRNGRLDRLEEAQLRALDAGMLALVAVLDVQMSACLTLRDGPSSALPSAERAMERAERLRLAQVGAVARYFAAMGRLYAGETAAAKRLIDQARTLAPDSVDVRVWSADLWGWAAWLDGDPATAATIFGDGLDLRRNRAASPAPTFGFWAVLRTALDPEDDGPRETLRASDVLIHACNSGSLRYADAVAAAHRGDTERADRLVVAGDDMMAAHTAWRHMLRVALAETAARERFGEPEAWLRAALADFEGTKEVRQLRLCRELMRRLGYPIPRAQRGAAGVPAWLRERGVTPREVEVLELVEEGLTNAEIAARLYLSTRTVETHVANLLAKTGLPSRVALRDGRVRSGEALSP
jgi:DNA-binding CsgD family transcriptional regulator